MTDGSKIMSGTDGIEWKRENNISTEDWLCCPYCDSDCVECQYSGADDGTTLYQCQNCGLGLEIW